MALVVISYPNISSDNLDWIQSVRSQHDDQYKIILPHFTLVFPCSIECFTDLIVHVQQKASEVKPMSFAIRRAITVKDSLSQNTHLFLIPEDGSSDLIKLHDILYTDLLSSQLRLDIPFDYD